ncbi:hypothetical protein AB0O38_16100 [Pseudarthrobacter oxydans]|uniref:hypothetical protein n=1 Tax=Pseudarthrobacter oxydans TaxID=1671 RepID=UPI003418C4D6
MSKHQAIAFERGTYGDQGQQKGYAARCETCGAVTFGGFRTKTAAKAALLHSEPIAPQSPQASR